MFKVIDRETGRALDGIPSPLLIQTGFGDAYEDIPGFWRLREDAYDKERKPQYRRVRIERWYQWIVDLEIEVVDLSDDLVSTYGSEPERMDLWVDAPDRRTAEDLAKEQAIERTREWAGDVSTVTTFLGAERQS